MAHSKYTNDMQALTGAICCATHYNYISLTKNITSNALRLLWSLVSVIIFSMAGIINWTTSSPTKTRPERSGMSLRCDQDKRLQRAFWQTPAPRARVLPSQKQKFGTEFVKGVFYIFFLTSNDSRASKKSHIKQLPSQRLMSFRNHKKPCPAGNHRKYIHKLFQSVKSFKPSPLLCQTWRRDLKRAFSHFRQWTCPPA